MTGKTPTVSTYHLHYRHALMVTLGKTDKTPVDGGQQGAPALMMVLVSMIADTVEAGDCGLFSHLSETTRKQVEYCLTSMLKFKAKIIIAKKAQCYYVLVRYLFVLITNLLRKQLH